MTTHDSTNFQPKPSGRFNDLENKRFGRLTVLGYLGRSKSKHSMWLCKCDCGNTSSVSMQNLIRTHTQSCGCLENESRKAGARKTHGRRKTRLYRIWTGMKVRCKNPKYRRYGGRGITVCDRWQTFENFAADMGEPPTDLHTLDRIDSNGHYEPGNVRWASAKIQSNNTSRNAVFKFQGERKTLAEWCDETGLDYQMVWARIHRLGWPIERALARPNLS